MPANIKGKHYDLRPYVDELDWVVIRRENDIARFKYHTNGKLVFQNMSGYRIDKYTLSKMMRHARRVIPILVK